MGKSKKCTIAIIILLLALIFASVWASCFLVETTHFEYKSPKISRGVKMVILADLHNHEFGEGNSELISKIVKEKPDIILILGDMLNSDSDDSRVAVDAAKGLVRIAPVYYAMGNHEIMYIENTGESLIAELEDTGVKILEMSSQDIEVNGQKMRIGGMFDYAFALDGEDSTNPEHMKPEVYEFLTDFQETDDFKLMMSHRPDSFVFGDAPKTWDIDLVISAHNHGGQVILPFVGGLFGGDQGWFPEYVYGMYSFEKYDMLITRGLGSNPKILPRFNNRPEVMVLTLKPEA